MLAGRIIFICMLWRSSAGDGVFKSHLVVGTISITSVEELLDLDLPLNEAMIYRQ